MQMLEWIYDTLWEFWQYLQPKGCVYIAGYKYKDRYILMKLVPEALPMGNGWEQLTESMSHEQAAKRLDHFQLIRLVEPKDSPETGT